MEERPAELMAGMSPARQILMQHQWLTLRAMSAVASEMQRINDAQPLIEPPTEQARFDRLDELGEILEIRLRRIRGYLGERWNSPIPNALDAVKKIRERIQKGDSDEELALFLGFYFGACFPITHLPTASNNEPFRALGPRSLQTLFNFHRWQHIQKPGRKLGSTDSDGIALRALELHESNPKQWTWPKVADKLCDCKTHTPHEWDSSCTAKLKKAVSRLQSFLTELPRTWETPPTVT